MRRFLYFIPGMPGANPAMLRKLGVYDRFSSRGKTIPHQITGMPGGGPGNKPGCIVSAGPEIAEYAPDRQRWLEGKTFWVGCDDAPIRPSDLERDEGIEGYVITLGDGQRWRVPLILKWDETRTEPAINLPSTLTPKLADGHYAYERVVHPDYARAYAIGRGILNSFLSDREISLPETIEAAASLLNVNYRIGVEECGLLGLLDEASAVAAMVHAIDWPAIQNAAAALASTGVQMRPEIAPEEE